MKFVDTDSLKKLAKANEERLAKAKDRLINNPCKENYSNYLFAYSYQTIIIGFLATPLKKRECYIKQLISSSLVKNEEADRQARRQFIIDVTDCKLLEE